MNDNVAEAVFLASLPTGDKGDLTPGHTTWEQLGPKAQERYRRMAEAALATCGERASLAYIESVGAELAEEYRPAYEALKAAKHQQMRERTI